MVVQSKEETKRPESEATTRSTNINKETNPIIINQLQKSSKSIIVKILGYKDDNLFSTLELNGNTTIEVQ